MGKLKKKIKLVNKMPAKHQSRKEKLREKKVKLKCLNEDGVKYSKKVMSSTEDDMTIHKMERLMNIQAGKRPKLPSGFCQDGLDYILDAVDLSSDVSFQDEIDSDDQSEPNAERDRISRSKDKTCDVVTSDDDIDINSEDENEDFSDDDNNSTGTEDNDITEDNDSTGTEDKANPNNTSTLKYVPPACRSTDHEETKKYENIKRQLKGLINRVTESNLQSICFEIENFYKTNSRARITQLLSDIILLQFYTPDSIPERLITESAMVVAVLCHNIGNEVVSYFLEAAAKKLHDLLLTDNRGEGKECNNVVQLICSLYQFKIIQKQLVLDVVQILINSFTERDVELLVVILKSIGFQLRKDDPVSLKSIVEQVTLKSSSSRDDQSSRMKFMLEILTAIKNNNVRKVLGYDMDLVNSRRKQIKLICNNHSDVFADVKLDDLVNADQQGRWWIVGSSWGGAPMLKAVEKDVFEPKASSKLIEAAKKLRMNTDIRKKIFYAVMSSSDFIEAFQNVNQLKLTGKQQREICHVIIECCQREKNFNPYYFHLINKFCHRDRQFIMTAQCSFWDRFKSLESLADKHNFNIAKLLSGLLLSQALPLSCLKTFEFSQIGKPGVSFLRRVLSNLAKDAKSVAELDQVFLKLDSKKHALVKNGLRLFIQHFMLNDATYMKRNIGLESALRRMDQKLDSHRDALISDSFY